MSQRMVRTGSLCVALVLFCAEGFLGSPLSSTSSFIVLLNATDETSSVSLTAVGPAGDTSSSMSSVPGRSLAILNTWPQLPSPWGGAVQVKCDQPLVCMVETYWTGADECRTTDAGSCAFPYLSKEWYFAEGSTQGGMQTFITVQNTRGGETAQVELTYLTPDGPRPGPAFALNPRQRETVNVADGVPDAARVAAVVEADVPVAAVRTMVWNDGKSVQNDAGISSPSSTWYMAEGSTADGFDTYLVVQNPNARPAEVSVRYVADGISQRTPTFLVLPQSVTDVPVGASLPDQMAFSAVVQSDPPVVVEQSTLWDGGQGFDTVSGVPSPSSAWYFPEGTTANGFDSWIAIQNPGSTEAAVDVLFTTDQGMMQGPSAMVPPSGTYSISFSDGIGWGTSGAAIVTSSIPVLAQQGTARQCGDGLYRDLQFGSSMGALTWDVLMSPYDGEAGRILGP